MCGIGAIYGKASRNTLDKMLDLIDHRGPDENGVWEGPGVMLGHKRLSITGISHGRQPIPNETKRIWVVCNGEIYNHNQLREDQLGRHSFVGESDCEVVLHLYEDHGVGALDFMEGMFAFVLADCRGAKPVIFAARDPLGIKPLYYAVVDGDMFFASELKCLFDITDDVFEFPPGKYYLTGSGFKSYRTVESLVAGTVVSENADLSEVKAGLREILEESVYTHLKADVPVGMFLSGGLDSSLMCSIAKPMQKGKLKTFCVGTAGCSDLLAAREVADYLGTEHYEYIYTEDELWNAIPRVIYFLESFEPSLVRSAVPNYFLCRLASSYVKAVLSGEGADELFGGYAYMKSILGHEKFNQELIRTLETAHNIGLQRLDRMTMAYSMEGRVPFLDEKVVKYTFGIPAQWKLMEKDGQKIEKWILREAYSGKGYLPEDILWRTKEEFSEGSGAKDVLQERLDNSIDDHEFEREQKKILMRDSVSIRTKQELHFYRIFKKFYPQPSALKTVGKWAIA
ncbi:MAG TPA: asparagine synthase B [Clostridia bacterium]|nr:asparagine synthase B [Clostridia bacterium]